MKTGLKVLHLGVGNLFGGVETVLTTIARMRASCPEMDPHFAVCFDGRLAEELILSGAPVHRLGRVTMSRPWTVWNARRTLRTLLARIQPDIVIAHNLWPHVMFGPTIIRSGRPLVLWAHDYPNPRHWIGQLAKHCKPSLAICNSAFTEKGVQAMMPSTPTRVLFCPVALVATPSKEERTIARSTFQVAPDQVILLQLSRIELYKGHKVLLEALANLKDLPQWEWWIAGQAVRKEDHALVQAITVAAETYGIQHRIRWLGSRRDVPVVLAASDILCQANTSPEPFGLVFVEALAAGLPVVTSALGGALEIVTPECGRVVPVGAVEHLSAALRDLIVDASLRERLGASGPERARLLCRAETRIKDLYDILAPYKEATTRV